MWLRESSMVKNLQVSPSFTRRLVNKSGDFRVNLEAVTLTKRLRKYGGDLFTTLMEAQWRWTLLFIAAGFFTTWFVFAIFYFVFGKVHGDMREMNPSTFIPCAERVNSFITALLFSVESQHTIGYGSRHVTDQCPHIITAVFFQFIIGVGVQCLIAGLFFAKLQRAKKRLQTIVFSRTACISYFNDQPCLSIRVGNLRSSLLLNVRAMAMLVKKTTNKGNEIFLTQHYIDMFSESMNKRINLFWPEIIYHPINESSPLYNSDKNLSLMGYSELIVILEGVVDSTSKTFQARTSYLPDEIVHGFRFKSLMPVLNSHNVYQVSYIDFNTVLPTNVQPKKDISYKDSYCQTIDAGYCSSNSNRYLRSWKSLNDVNRVYSFYNANTINDIPNHVTENVAISHENEGHQNDRSKNHKVNKRDECLENTFNHNHMSSYDATFIDYQPVI